MKTTLLIATLVFVVGTSANAATVSINGALPTVDGADIANDNGTADAGGNQGHVWSNRPHQGQSFTTGSNAAGYQLSAVTLKNRNNNVTNGPTFNVVIGTLVGSTLTQIGATETAVAPNYSPGDYITFTLDTPITLAPNTAHGFLWGTAGQGFVTVNNLADATYAGGTALSSGDNNVPVLGNVIPRNVDRVFHADLTAIASASVPDPATATLALLGLGGLMMRRRRAA